MVPEIQRKTKNKQMKNIIEFHNQTKSEIMTVSMIDEDLQKKQDYLNHFSAFIRCLFSQQLFQQVMKKIKYDSCKKVF